MFSFNQFSLSLSLIRHAVQREQEHINKFEYIFSELNFQLLNQEANLALRMVRIVRFDLLIHYLYNLFGLKTKTKAHKTHAHTHSQQSAISEKMECKKSSNTQDNSKQGLKFSREFTYFLNVTIYKQHRQQGRQPGRLTHTQTQTHNYNPGGSL